MPDPLPPEPSMNAGFEQAQQLASLWMEFAAKMATTPGALPFRPEQTPTEAARAARDAAFGTMGQQADKYMRSPQFLEQVKQTLDASIGFRKQINDFFTQAHHSVQGVARQDVDAVFRSIRHMETRVLDRIENLCDRLDEVSRRLDAIEGGAGAAAQDNGRAERPARKRSGAGAASAGA